MEQREALGLQGLLPPGEADLDTEVARAVAALEQTANSPLAKYQTLMTLRETNAAAFFALLQQARVDWRGCEHASSYRL
jgi:hypothetical protein